MGRILGECGVMEFKGVEDFKEVVICRGYYCWRVSKIRVESCLLDYFSRSSFCDVRVLEFRLDWMEEGDEGGK